MRQLYRLRDGDVFSVGAGCANGRVYRRGDHFEDRPQLTVTEVVTKKDTLFASFKDDGEWTINLIQRAILHLMFFGKRWRKPVAYKIRFEESKEER